MKIRIVFALFLTFMSVAVKSLELQQSQDYSESEKQVINELKNGIQSLEPVVLEDPIIEDQNAKKVLDIIKDTKRTFTPSFQKKGAVNPNLTVYRDNDQVVTINMTTEDIVDTNICVHSPIRVLLGNSIADEISQAILDTPKSFSAEILNDKRSAMIMMANGMKRDGTVFRSRVRLIRKSDFKSYIINLNAQACPASGRFGFPSEIIIEDKQKSGINENVNLKTPEDLILDITDGLPRKNHENQIELYSGLMSPGSDYSMLAINIKIGNTTRDKFYPQFYVLDSLQGRVIEMQEPVYLAKESKAVTDRIKHSILRFNLFIKINKKYILERDSVYLVIVEHGERYYQKVKIPMSALREKLINHGYDLN